jgi:MOSC domain-containing protein YiiM
MRRMGRVTALFLFAHAGAPPEAVDEVVARPGGLVGDRRRSKRRQVTVLGLEGWQEATSAAGAPGTPPSARRANVVIEGVAVARLVGRRLRLGEAVLEVLGETDPCPKMNRVRPGLEDAMRPGLRGGVFGQVIGAGRIRVGDEVSVLAADHPSSATS